MRKIFSTVLIVSILLSSLTYIAFAAEENIVTPSQESGALISDYCTLSDDGWTMSTNTNVKGPYGVTNSWYSSNRNAKVTYKTPSLEAGYYGVYLWHTPYTDKTAEMLDIVINASGAQTFITFDADENLNNFKDKEWIYLGNYYFSDNANDSIVQKLNENSVRSLQRTAAVKFVKDDTSGVFTDFISNETLIIPSQNSSVKTTTFSSLSGSWGGMSTREEVYGPTDGYSWYTGNKSATAEYKAAVPVNGNYGVYVYMTPYATSSADKIDVTVTASGESKTVVIDGLHGGETWRHWYYLGKYNFNGNEADGVVQQINASAVSYDDETKSGNMRTSGVKFVKNDPNINDIGDIPPSESITLTEGEPYYLDSENSGFAKFGNWKPSSVPSLKAAPSYNASPAKSYAIWMINLGKISDVEISVPIIRNDDNEDSAGVFEIYHNGNTYTETVDFTTTDIGWHSLGKFDFAGDGTEYIKYTKTGSGSGRIINIKLAVNEKIVEVVNDEDSILFGTDLHIFERMGMYTADKITNEYLDKELTRADMAVMLTRLFGKVDEITSENNTDNFSDVPSDFWARRTIAYIKAHPEFGIKGHGKNSFSPNSHASKTELIKFLLHQLEYYEVTDYKPSQAYAKAKELGISVSNNEKLTPRTMGQIILSAFEIPVKNTSEYTFFEKLVRESSGVKDSELFSREALGNLIVEREKVKKATRGLIYNNDGNDIYEEYAEYPDDYPVDNYVSDKTATITKANFLAGRTIGADTNGVINDVSKTTVGSIFYCTGVFNSYHHVSEDKTIDTRKRDWSYLLKDYTGDDTIKTMADYCETNNLEFFWSMRMNDTHDHQYREDQLDSWKKANLDKLVARKDKSLFMKYGNFRWSSVDYTHNESRQKVYDILKDVVSRAEYNLDGIELDFTRFPIYFKEVIRGIDVYPENVERMNDLMRMIRSLTDMYSAEKNKPILISIYVPDSMEYCKAIGLDIKTWLEEKLIDMVVVGELTRYQTWAESVAEYKPYNVPVYAALDDLAFKSFTVNNKKYTYDIEQEAAIAWNEGVDGVYIYNLWFNPKDSTANEYFNTIGNKETMVSAFDTSYKTFSKCGDEVTYGYVKIPVDNDDTDGKKGYTSEALIASKQTLEGLENSTN